MDVLVGHGHRTVGDERRAAGDELVQHDAERVDVAALVHGQALGLLGGEVRRRAHHGTGLGEVVLASNGHGDTEVGDLHVVVGGDEDVAGLHVAVDDAVAVGEPQGGGDVRSDGRGAPRGEASLFA